jgi:hypothetical protein
MNFAPESGFCWATLAQFWSDAEGISSGYGAQREVRSRFLKKAAQKLLLCWATGDVGENAHGPAHKVFLLLFVHKK